MQAGRTAKSPALSKSLDEAATLGASGARIASVEKTEAAELRVGVRLLVCCNTCFLGTSVESGVGKAVVLATGPQTYFGKVASSLAGQQVETSFDRGIKRYTWLMIRFMLVMVPLVFLINGLTKHNWHDAFFFSMAVAVGLTPEMLPMIVSVCLSKGALAMSKKKVIVKRLHPHGCPFELRQYVQRHWCERLAALCAHSSHPGAHEQPAL